MSHKPSPSSTPLYNSWDIANWLKETYGYEFSDVVYVLSRGKWFDTADKQLAVAIHRDFAARPGDKEEDSSILGLCFEAFGDEFCVYFKE